MKKGLSLILTAVFLTAMLMVGGMSALAAGEADPEDAKSVLDLSYLTKDQALGRFRRGRGISGSGLRQQ